MTAKGSRRNLRVWYSTVLIMVVVAQTYICVKLIELESTPSISIL